MKRWRTFRRGIAALNGTLAASDLFGGAAVAKGLFKGARLAEKAAESTAKNPYAWGLVRRRMGEMGLLEAGQHGHHWAIPQKGWGKNVPDFIKNHPLNIKPMPDAVTHWRLDHRVGELSRFNPAQRYWYGTPAWAKVGGGAAIGHPAAAAKARSEQQ